MTGPSDRYYQPPDPTEITCEECGEPASPDEDCESCGEYVRTEQERTEDAEWEAADRAYDMERERL